MHRSASLDFGSCVAYAFGGFREVATERSTRFLGKVTEDTARCRGGEAAVAWRKTPWIDWPLYWAAGGAESRVPRWLSQLGFLSPNNRGINGALLDLEYQRIELLKFNLFDNSGTYENYLRDRAKPRREAHKDLAAIQITEGHIRLRRGRRRWRANVLRRAHTLSHADRICNDILNPLMGSIDQPFARNVEFEATFPELSEDEIVRNRHGDRLGLLKPDPQVISRKLFTRAQTVALPIVSRRESREIRRTQVVTIKKPRT